jgi:hypothetical protein
MEWIRSAGEFVPPFGEFFAAAPDNVELLYEAVLRARERQCGK